MARKDEMSLDDELTAAFLSEEGNTEVAEEGLVESAESAPVEEEVYTEETTEDNWEDETENLPGQLAVDVYETADKLIIKARTAGIERKDLDVSISDNILTISGVLSGGEDDRATQWHIQECYWGEFSRTIALPVPVIEDGVEAVLKDGVLTISFEKEKTEEPKRIMIN
ncbi:Hsp20/alpha crystallin family protein [Candidatus Saccharibacteria bacterium]|nr:Hsp20/alpha crystallin family protein [Candidatus Saccharibacteria bacterium]